MPKKKKKLLTTITDDGRVVGVSIWDAIHDVIPRDRLRDLNGEIQEIVFRIWGGP